jgi:uncharacterized membrane protein
MLMLEPILMIEPITTVLVALLVPAFQAAIKALISQETLKQVLRSFTQRNVIIAFLLSGLGVLSLLLSYFDWLWVAAPHQSWWETVHLEAGMGLILIGFIDTLIMSRLEDRRAGTRQEDTSGMADGSPGNSRL